MPTPTDFATDIKALEFFNEKADKLKNLSFVRSLQSEDSGWQLSFQEGAATALRYGPDNESVEAFVLTFRFFIQDKDGISIRKMAERYSRLYDSSLISKELLDNFDEARSKLLDYLGSNTRLIVGGPDTTAKAITYQEVFDVFMWGGLAHARHKEQFDEWQKGSMQVVFPMLENDFVMILRTYLQVISYVQRLNEKVLTKFKHR
jgi:hypothetical protein